MNESEILPPADQSSFWEQNSMINPMQGRLSTVQEVDENSRSVMQS